MMINILESGQPQDIEIEPEEGTPFSLLFAEPATPVELSGEYDEEKQTWTLEGGADVFQQAPTATATVTNTKFGPDADGDSDWVPF